MPVIKPSKEIRSFKCPVCEKLFEIGTDNKEYITVHGNLTWGESIIFIGDPIGANSLKDPCRICKNCLVNILGGQINNTLRPEYLGRMEPRDPDEY